MQGVGDDVGTVPMVVIAEDREQRRPVQLPQNFGAGLGMARAGGSVRYEQRVGNEVAGEDGEIGLERQREANRAFDLGFADVGSKMQIAENGDAKSMKGFGQISQADGDVFGDQRMRLEQKSVDGDGSAHADRSDESLFEKTSTVQRVGSELAVEETLLIIGGIIGRDFAASTITG